jgi:hypothetical protein
MWAVIDYGFSVFSPWNLLIIAVVFLLVYRACRRIRAQHRIAVMDAIVLFACVSILIGLLLNPPVAKVRMIAGNERITKDAPSEHPGND